MLRRNLIFKILCSFPIIIVVAYFVPFLGVVLALFRYVVYGTRHYYRTPIVLLICGLVLLLPRGLELAMANFNFDLGVPYWNEIMSHQMYPKITDLGRFLAIFGVILLIVSYILKNFIAGMKNKFGSMMQSYYTDQQNRDERIRKENDLKLREKEITSKQKTPHVVKCKHCGKTNHITGTVGKCASCRQPIEWHE